MSVRLVLSILFFLVNSISLVLHSHISFIYQWQCIIITLAASSFLTILKAGKLQLPVCLLAWVDCSSVMYDAVSYPRRTDPHCCQNLISYVVHLCMEATLHPEIQKLRMNKPVTHGCTPADWICHPLLLWKPKNLLHYEVSGWSDLPTAYSDTLANEDNSFRNHIR